MTGAELKRLREELLPPMVGDRRIAHREFGVALGMSPNSDSAKRRVRKWECGDEVIPPLTETGILFLQYVCENKLRAVFDTYWAERFEKARYDPI